MRIFNTDELLQKIERIFNEHKLLGNIDFSEDEYAFLLDEVGRSCKNFLDFDDKFEETDYKLIFITLVEVAKRWKDPAAYEEDEKSSPFWVYICKHLINQDTFNQKLYHALTKIISVFEQDQSLPIADTGKKYYSTLMMHSFTPKNSIFSFYDLCYNIFKKDLDFSFTNDDEWLCEIVAQEMKTVLGGLYREDTKVSIGSSAYSIKIGLRSFSLHKDLSDDFVQFIKDTFYQINKLLNRDSINKNTRLERYVVEWWGNKAESEKVCSNMKNKRRTPAVLKENITAKFIRDGNSVFLYIPSIRINDINSTISLYIFKNNEQVHSEEMRTKRGELIVTTKQVELELNELLKDCNTINLRVEITENQTIIFDSERSKATSLNREFILFEGEKEVLSQINKPSNYFVYSRDIDALKRIPDELTTCRANLYNIYPNAGESLLGTVKQVFFVDNIKSSSIGERACLIGRELNLEWFYNDISCIVYSNSLKLLVPENVNLKALELRIDKNVHNLQDLNFERIESGCYQFGLKSIGLIGENYPTEINLYSYEEESTILSETIIVLPNLKIEFNHPFYYDNLERKLKVTNGDDSLELTWNNQDDEIKCPINTGVLLVKVAYLRWRINSNEWHNKPNDRKLWYQDLLKKGDILDIDNPRESDNLTVFYEVDGKRFEVFKNQSGKFEIGRSIYANEGIMEISIYMAYENREFKVFSVSTKEHFITNPLSYVDGSVYWNVKNTFIGDMNSEFLLTITSMNNNHRCKMSYSNANIINLHEDIYEIEVKIKNQNRLLKKDSYRKIYTGRLLVGSFDRIRFNHTRINLLKAQCFLDRGRFNEWRHFIPSYFIDNLKFVQENEYIYYSGDLCVIDQNGKTKVLDFMINEEHEHVKINPVRIELRDNNTLWMVAGLDEDGDILGELFYDKQRKGICNIQKQDKFFDGISLYKFKEEKKYV